jgi:hypothetical protein
MLFVRIDDFESNSTLFLILCLSLDAAKSCERTSFLSCWMWRKVVMRGQPTFTGLEVCVCAFMPYRITY